MPDISKPMSVECPKPMYVIILINQINFLLYIKHTTTKLRFSWSSCNILNPHFYNVCNGFCHARVDGRVVAIVPSSVRLCKLPEVVLFIFTTSIPRPRYST